MEPSRSSAQPTNQREIDLVEKAYWQLALTDTDDKLERALGRLLAPVLLKASSKDAAVRDKVKDIIHHVIERLNNLDQVRLPMEALFLQCQSQQTEEPTLVYNIRLLAIGYVRLSAKDRAGFAVDVLKCLPQKSSAQQASLLRLFVMGLAELKLPKDVQGRKVFLAFLDDFKTSKEALLSFFEDFLLLPYGKVPLPSSAEPLPLVNDPSSVVDDTEPRVAKAPPGLSFAAVEHVTGGEFLEPEALEKVKMDVLRFLTSEVFTEEEIILHLLIATGDTRQSVADFAEDKLKIFGSPFDWNCKPIVLRIYSLFHGSPQPQSRQQQSRPQSAAAGPNADLQRSPAHIRLKLKLVPYLLKSNVAADMFPQSVQLVFECLFGAETHARLKLLGAQFLHHMCERSSDTLLARTAPVLLNGLYKVISSEQENQKLREVAFVGIGKLAHRTPQLFRKDISHAVKMFDALGKEAQDVCLAVLECLSMLSPAYIGATGLAATALEALVLEHIESELPRVRLAAAHFTNTVFPSDHVPSCYVRILAAGDERHDIREEAKKGLCLAEKEGDEFKFPNFSVLVTYLAGRCAKRLQRGHGYTTSSSSMPLTPVTFGVALNFCQTCLHRGGGISKQQELTLAFLLPLKKHLEALCASKEGKEVVALYLDLIKQALAPCGGGELHGTAMECMLELVATSPSHTIQGLLLDTTWVKGFLGSPHSGTREKTARLLGFLSASMSDAQLTTLLNELLQEADSKDLEHQHGAILALGFVGKPALLQSTVRARQVETEEQADIVELQSKRPRAGDITLDVLTKLASFVSPSGTKLLSAAACASIGELARVAPLPLPDGTDEGTEKKATAGSKEAMVSKVTQDCSSKSGVVQLLGDYLDRVSDAKCKRQAAVALGLLVVGDENFPCVKMVLTSLFETVQVKQFDLHMTVGEAISCAAAGRFSKAATDHWEAVYSRVPEGQVVQEEQVKDAVPKSIQETLQWTLEMLISTKYAVSYVLGQRQAAGLWLVALLKFSGHLAVIKEHLKDFQMVFVNMLADDAVTQEVASSGLGLVYELSGGEQKKEIVSTLTSTLLSGRKPTRTLSSDSKLFPEGVLGKSPSGQSLTTYKELCSVASDMNQPDLIYKFLSLSTHHSVWNSKKGAAFGFQHISEQAKEELKPHLPTLVPKLYRYQYDPHGGIQQSMKSIWSSVVPDSKRAVAQYQKEIMHDLMQNLNHTLWRNRESSCLALSDLLVVSPTEDILPYLPELWDLCLRVQDDIKESVRQAASSACHSLYKVTLRVCDVAGEAARATVDQTLGEIFPLLLEKGMASPAENVRGISLLTLLKLTKEAGSLLKPHIPLLVPVLLENVSSLEPQVLNYISLKLEDSEDQEKLDQIRVSSAKSSPLMEAARFCMPHIDAQVMERLVPRLADIIKSGVGVSTKVNTAQFVVMLDRQSRQELSPFIGKVMAALLAGLGDRSAGVRKAYANALGQLTRSAKLSSLQKLNDKLKTRFFEKNDPSTVSTIAAVYRSMVMHSADAVSSVKDQVVPLVFLAMHDRPDRDSGDSVHEAGQQAWKDVWEELVTGTESAVAMYLPEIEALVCSTLRETQSWLLKAQAAAAIATLAEKAGPRLVPPHLWSVCGALVEALPGRVWEGKAYLLKAVKTVFTTCKEEVEKGRGDAPVPVEKVLEAVLKECRKKDVLYRTAAMDSLGGIVEAYNIDMFSEVFKLAQQTINPEKSSSSDDEEEGGRGKRPDNANIQLAVQACILMGKAWPTVASTQKEYLLPVFSLVCEHAMGSVWKVQVAMMSTVAIVFNKLKEFPLSSEDFSLKLAAFVPVCSSCLGNIKYSSVRLKTLEAIKSLVVALKGCAGLPTLLTPELVDAMNGLQNPKEKELVDAILKSGE